MTINNKLLDELTTQAKANPRLRQNFDLRNTPNDQSQRMLNAMEPGTQLPIHRHTTSSETVIVLRGAIRQNEYNNRGELINQFIAQPGGDNFGFCVEAGVWHRAESLLTGTIIIECKDGAWQPLSNEDILDIQ